MTPSARADLLRAVNVAAVILQVVACTPRLIFVSQPRTTPVGLPIDPRITVRAETPDGQPIANVQVTIADATQNAALGCTLTAAGGTATTNALGLAAFSSVVLNGPCANARLVAKGVIPGIVQFRGVSEPFDVPPQRFYVIWEPRAVTSGQTNPVAIRAVIPDLPAVAQVTLIGGATIPLTRSGYTYAATLSAAQVFANYRAGDDHVVVGYLDSFNNIGTRTARHNLVMNVRDASIPTVTVVSYSPAMQASPHVVNLRYDKLYLGDPAPPEVMKAFYQSLSDAYDFIAVVEQVEAYQNRFFLSVQNALQGIGTNIFNNTANYGSAGRLQGIIHFPLPSFFDLAATASLHEIGHRWMNYLNHPLLHPGNPHWPIGDMAYGIMGFSGAQAQQGMQFSYQLVARPDGSYQTNCIPQARQFNDLELYLMGLIPKEQVGTHFVFTNQPDPTLLTCGGVIPGPVQTVTINDIIAVDGERPLVTGNPLAGPVINLATIVLSAGRLLSADEMTFFDHMAARGEANAALPYTGGLDRGTTLPFSLATGGRVQLRTAVP